MRNPSRRFCWLIIILILLVAPFIAQGADPQPRETWEVIRSGESRFGSIHTTITPLADGGERIERQIRYLVDLFGQRQEIKESRQWIVGPGQTPISSQLESQGQAGESKAEAKVGGRAIRVTITRGAARLERQIELPEGAIFDVSLPARLAQQPADATDFTASVIDSDSWRLNKLTAKRMPSTQGKSRWKVGDAEWTISASGVREEYVNTQIDRVTQSATAEQAAKIDYLKFSPRELLTFAVKQNIPFPERAKKIIARIAWRDFPLDEMQLEDPRQKIVTQDKQQSGYQIVLELTQPPAIDNSPAFPVDDPKLAEYLADDEFIQPSSAQIREQAKLWTAGAKTSLEAVQAMSRQVAELLQGGELVAETLSGPEVLACRKGKCTEFTTLLASLLRSVGVPTRVALGMRMVGGQWVGHMWCEAWIGQWIPVDATMDEVGGSPALLKLTHSSTVAGTQRVRWAMTRSLEVDVQSFEPGDRKDVGLKTGIVRQTYSNADFACRITAPDGWTWEDKKEAGATIVQCTPPKGADGKEPPLVHFVAFALPPKVEAGVLVAARKGRFASMYKGFEVTTDEAQDVGAAKGRRFAFTRENPTNADQTIKTTEILWTGDRCGFILNIIADSAAHDEAFAAFEKLLASFETVTAPEK